MANRDITFRLKGEDQTHGAFSSVSKQFSSLGQGLLKVGAIAGGAALAGVTALAGGIAALATTGIQKAADLDAQMATIAATMNTTKAAVGPLKDLILDLALDPKLTVTATEAADAIQLLAQNGATADQIMGGLAKATVALANATGANFGTAADVASGVMTVFGLKASEVATAIDGITGVTNQSKFTIDDYAQAFAQAGGIAAGMGVKLDDFNAVIAATATSFKSGSDAGTSFKTFLQRLANPTAKMEAVMQDLGISLFDSEGQMRNIKDVAGQLHSAFGELTEAERAEAAAKLGGADAARTVIALSKISADEFDRLSGSVNQSGQAFRAAATRVDSVKGAFDIFKGIIEALQIQIGDKFLPILKRIMVGFSDMASGIGPQVVGLFGKVANSITGLVDAGIDLFEVFQSKGLAGIFASMGLEGSALFFKKLGELFGMLGGEATSLGDILRNTVGSVMEWLSHNLFPTLTEGVKFIIAHFEEFKGALMGVGAVLAAGVFAALAAAVIGLLSPINLLITGAALLGAAWAGNWGDIQGKTAAAWATIQPILQEAGTWLSVNIPIAIQTLTDLWNGTLLPAFQAYAAYMTGTVFPVYATLFNWLSVNIPAAIESVSGFWTGTFLPAMTRVGDFVDANLLPLMRAMNDFFMAVLGKTIEASAGLWQNILLPALEKVGAYLSDTFGPAFEAIGKMISEKVGPPAKSFSDNVLPALKKGLDGVTAAIKRATDFFKSLADAVSNFSLPPVLTPGSPTPFELALRGIAAAAAQAGGSFDGLQAGLDQLFGLKNVDTSIGPMISKAALQLEQGLDNFLSKSKSGFIADAFKRVFEQNADLIGTATDEQLQALLEGAVGNWGRVGGEVARLFEGKGGGVASTFIQLFKNISDRVNQEAAAAAAENFKKMVSGIGQFAGQANSEAEQLAQKIATLQTLLRQGVGQINLEGQLVGAAQAQERLNELVMEHAGLQGNLGHIQDVSERLQNASQRQGLLDQLGGPGGMGAGATIAGLANLTDFTMSRLAAAGGSGGRAYNIYGDIVINSTQSEGSILQELEGLGQLLPSGT